MIHLIYYPTRISMDRSLRYVSGKHRNSHGFAKQTFGAVFRRWLRLIAFPFMRQVDFTVARPKIKRPFTKSQETRRRKAISSVLFLQRADQKGFPWGGSGPSRINHNDQLHKFSSEFEIPRHTFYFPRSMGINVSQISLL